jgi:hypothetical protein
VEWVVCLGADFCIDFAVGASAGIMTEEKGRVVFMEHGVWVVS